MNGSPRRCAVFGALVAALAVLSTGCVRSQVAIAISPEDKVTGEIVVAVVVPTEQDQGAALVPPSDIGPRVRAEPYRQDGYAGTRLLFTGLSFDEFARLNQMPDGEGNRLRFQLRRAGDLVLFTGRVDLVQIAAPERVDVAVRMSFPGRVTATNGKQTGNEISWQPPAGQLTDLTATVRYADPAAAPWIRWAAMVGGLAGFVVIVVLLLAFLAHRRSLRTASS